VSKSAVGPTQVSQARKPHPIDVLVGKRLRTRRKMLGISQEGLSESVGVTFQQVQKYEKGTNRISASRLYEISIVLRVPITYFFEGAAKLGTVAVRSGRNQGPDAGSGTGVF
jgi:transcriptional regulator with XRE-family HTH domain